MSAALVRKALRDAALLLAVLAAAALAFEMLLVSAFADQAEQVGEVLRSLTFARRVVESLFGQDVLDNLTPATLFAVGLAHPLLYAFIWSLLITVGTRALVGELDRGTADLLLALPVSRTRVYGSVVAVLLLCALVMSVMPAVGLWLGQRINQPSETIAPQRLAVIATNLLLLNAAVVGLTLLLSSICSRRGTAVAVVLAILLGSFLLGFLAQTWPPAQRIAFLSVLHYYQPLQIVRDGEFPTASASTLAAFALATGVVGWLYFRRRDIPAV